jgi:hypothetical protein
MSIKKSSVAVSLIAILSLSALQADGLKNSLLKVLKQKDDTHLVDLSGLDINAKPIPKQPMALNSRPANTIVAIVEGKSIKKSTLDKFLAKVSNGKVKDFDMLQPKQRKMLVQQYYLPKYIASQAIAQIPKEKRYEIYKAIWMRKKASSIKISEEQIKQLYEQMSSQANATHQMLPPYQNIQDRIKMQLIDDEMTKYILKDANITLSEPNPMQIVGSIDGDFVSVGDVEPIVQKISRGKAHWNMLNPSDKKRVLEMIAVQKIAQKVALKELSLDEKYNAISNVWIQEQIKDIIISQKDIKKAYQKLKKRYKKGKVPSYDEAKESLKMELARDKYMQRLIKQIKVKLK